MLDVELLNRRKKELKLNYEQLVKMTGYSRRALIRIFHGETLYPRLDTIQSLASALELNCDDISKPDIVQSKTQNISVNEIRLLEAYRSLIPPMQEYVLQMIEGLIKQPQNLSKTKQA